MTSRKTVLVTGCSSGFGRLTAETLLAKGHRVFAGIRSSKEPAKGLGSDVVTLDVTDDASVERAFAVVRERAGGLDVLINNAGLSAMGVAEGFTPGQLLALLEVNLLGVHRVTRAALPLLRASASESALALFVSTGLSRLPMPCFGPYAASKAAVEALAETYRYELGPQGIDAVIVQPGPYPTSLGASALQPGDPSRLAPYGELARLPEKMMAGMKAWFDGPQAPNPQDVPDAIVRLIESPAGTRPLRVVVGGTGGPAEELNALSDRLQAEVLRSQGLESLLSRPR